MVKDKFVLRYYKDKDINSYVTIPPEDRRSIIENAHLAGHFQVTTTIERIRRLYKWPGLSRDTEFYIQQCRSCLRNKKYAVSSHPAMSVEVDGIFDRIGMDLVFGFEKTTEGYCGIMVITEYLSKFVFARPIKSKEAREVFRVLWEYVSIFGPPAQIITDQGTEFNNNLLAQFTAAVGVTHRVTSAYNPRANGQTERSNATVVESLRSTCDAFKSEWPQFVAFVTWAYNTRRHSVTGKTPYALVYGK